VIPRIFHQIWVGPNPYPAEFEEFRQTWRQAHPDWEFRLWGEDDLPADLRRQEIYDRSRVPAERSDMLRFEILWRHGGVYMDTDFECRRPIDELLEGVDFFTALLKPGGRVNNAIFGAVAGHPALDDGLRSMRAQEPGAPFDKSASGPLFFAELLKRHPDAKIFPAEWFYPSTPAQREDAYAVHHSARSWKDTEGWRQAALRAEERLDKERKAHDKTKRTVEELQRDVKALKEKLKKARGRSPDEPQPAEEAEGAKAGAFAFLRSRS
jgi:mannosyltransferase OCH1-like enzyme